MKRGALWFVLGGFLLLTLPVWGQTPGTVLWSFQTGSDIFSSPAIGSDGTIYFGSSDGIFRALNPDGTKKWEFATDGNIASSPAVAPDGTIYFGLAASRSFNNGVYALNPNGSRKWFYASGGADVFSSPSIGLDGSIYIGLYQSLTLVVLNPADGSEKKAYYLRSNIFSSPAVASDGTIYSGTLDRTIWALNPSGSSKWTFETQGQIFSSPTIGPDGTIYVGSFDNNFYALNPDGSVRWKFPTGDAISATAAIGRDGTIYIGSYDDNFYALRPDGTLKWSFKSPGQIRSSAAVASDGTIYFASWDQSTIEQGIGGKVIALNPDGSKAWDLRVNDVIHGSPTIGANGTIYIGSFDDKLYAIKGSFGPVISARPMFRPIGGHAAQLPALITLTSPRPNAVFTAPANIPLEANVQTAAGVQVSRVEFYQETSEFTAIGSVTSPPYRFTASVGPTNNYLYSARVVVSVPSGGTETIGSDAVLVRVVQFNNPPFISSITNQFVYKSATIDFTIGDVETAATDLTVTGKSLIPTIVPDANIVFGGSGSNRVVVITPITNSGTNDITLTVSDGEKTSTRTFTLTVIPQNTLPDISSINTVNLFEDAPVPPINFLVSDADTDDPPEKLIVSARSSNTSLVPNENLLLSGTGLERTLTLSTVTNQSGTATITLTVRDTKGATNSTSFQLIVAAQDDIPTISLVPNQTVIENKVLGPLPLIIRDVDSDLSNLDFTIDSSNPGLIAITNVVITGNGGDRNITITPTANKTGSSQITLIVSVHGSFSGSARRDFLVTVVPGNKPPSISIVPDQTTTQGTAVGPISFVISDQETPAAQLQLRGTTSNSSLIPASGISFGGSNGNRTVTLNPAAGQFGEATITLIVTDGEGLTTATSFKLTVNPGNRPPIISQLINAVADEDTLVQIPFRVFDPDSPASGLLLSYVSLNTSLVPSTGISIVGSDTNRTLVIRPATNQIGSTTITLGISDGSLTNSTTFNLAVSPVNDAPVITVPPSATIDEDTPFSLSSVTLNDVDAGIGFLQLSLEAAHGTFIFASSDRLTFNSGGAVGSSNIVVLGTLANLQAAMTGLSYVPLTNSFVPDILYLTMNDQGNSGKGSPLFDRKFIGLTIQPVNDLPVISVIPDQTVNAGASTPVLPFTVDDVETPANSLKISVDSSNPSLIPTNNIVIGGSGPSHTVQITAPDGPSGTATITITATDVSNGKSARSFVVTVIGGNTRPTISQIDPQSVDEDTRTTAIPFTIHDAETPAADLALSAVSSNQSLVANTNITLGGSAENRTLTILPSTNQFGTVTITVTVSDGKLSATSIFTLEIKPVNDPPTLDSIGDISLLEDSPAQQIQLTGISTGAPNEDEELTWTITSDRPAIVPAPTISYTPKSPAATLTYQPVHDASGIATIAVVLSDGTQSITRIFTIDVRDINDAPGFVKGPDITVKQSSGALTYPNWATQITAGTPAEAGQALTFIVTPDNQSLFTVQPAVSPTGNLTFTPAPGASGTTDVQIRLQDNGGTANGGKNLSAAQVFRISLSPSNQAPTIGDLSPFRIREDSPPISIDLAGITSGSVDEVQFLTVTAKSSDPSVLPDPVIEYTSPETAGILTLQPAPNASGIVTVTVTVHDDGGTVNGGVDTISKTFTVTIDPVNDRPTISPISDQAIAEGGTTGPLPFQINDIDSPISSLALTAASSNTGLLPLDQITFGGSGTNRTVTLAPLPGQSGQTLVSIIVSDGLLSATNQFVLTVSAVNKAPTLTTIPDQVINEDSSTDLLPFTIGDLDTPLQNLIISSSSSDTNLLDSSGIALSGLGADRSLKLTPLPNHSGSTVISLAVWDGGLGVTNRFTLTVRPVNDPPVFIKGPNITINEDAGPQSISAWATGIQPGAPDETGQVVSFVLSNDNASLFAAAPSITPGGTLAFTPAANAFGVATVTVRLKDNGGTDNGGNDTSASQTFTITVNPVNDPPTLGDSLNFTIKEDSPPLEFGLFDISSGATNEIQKLTVTVVSSDPSVIPSPEVDYSSPSDSAFLRFQPVPNATGRSTITVTIADDGGTANGGKDTITKSFTVTVNPVNDPPFISSISDQSIEEDGNTGPIPFTIGDIDSSPNSLTVTAASSNPALLPLSRITLAGDTTNRTVTLAPLPGQSGQTIVSLVVSDGSLTATNSFRLTVAHVTRVPVIGLIASQTIDEDTKLGPITFVVSDPDTPVTNLIVTATSTDQTLVPNTAITLSGSGTNRTLTLTPATNQFGITSITLVVTDGALSATNSFQLTVRAVNDPPTISSIPAQAMTVGSTLTGVTFVVGDVETPANQLTVTATSSETRLIPNAGITIDGTGANRTLSIKPFDCSVSGSSVITLKVSDGALETSTAFSVTINELGRPLLINAPSSQTINEDESVTVDFSVYPVYPLSCGPLTIYVESSNPALIPTNNLTITANGTNGTLRISPAKDQNGSAAVTLIAIDGGGLSAARGIQITVVPVNDAPAINPVPDQITNQDTPLVFSITIGDIDTPTSSLVVSGASSNTALIPAGGITSTGSGTNRIVTIRPATGQQGSALITLAVSDGSATAAASFNLQVVAPNTPPAITSQPQGRTVLVGTTVEFKAGVTGTAPLKYQWRLNGTNLNGATNASLVLNNVQTGSGGRYSVVVTNGAGSVTSDDALLVVGQLGAKLWDSATTGQIRSSPAIGSNGVIYIGSDDGRLYAISSGGARLWSYSVGSPIGSSPAIGPDGTIYFGAQNNSLYALKPDGTLRWRYGTANFVESSPAIAADGTIYVGTHNNSLLAVNPDGTRKWEFATGGIVYSSPALSGNGSIYFGSYDGKFYALNPDGTKQWEYSVGNVIATSPALAANGTIYFGASDRKLYALSPGGTLVWQYSTSASINSSPAIGADGTIYFGADDGRLYAVSSSGARRWEFVTGSSLFATPAVGEDGTIYVGSFDSKLYAVNANGSKRWEYVATGPFYSSPAVDGDGVVYLGSYDNRVYAIKGTTGLASSAWPMFRRNLSHTARAPIGAPQPPRINVPTLQFDGSIQLVFSTETGRTYSVEVSTNLVQWTKLADLTATSVITSYTDHATGSSAIRFYRVVVQ